MSHKKRTSRLVGPVIEAMRERNRLEHEIFSYFHFDSRFRRALERHICTFKDIIIDLPYADCRPYYPRGQGPLSVKKVWAYSTQFGKDNKPYEPDVFGFEFTVLYTSEEVGEEEIGHRYELQVPLTLIDDECDDAEFNRRFDEWIEQKRAERKAKETADDLEKLKALAKKHKIKLPE